LCRRGTKPTLVDSALNAVSNPTVSLLDKLHNIPESMVNVA